MDSPLLFTLLLLLTLLLFGPIPPTSLRGQGDDPQQDLITDQNQDSVPPAEIEIFKRIGVMKTPLVTESSGLTVSTLHPQTYWTVNDSGNTNEVFWFSFSGELLARVELENSRNRDWESMSWFRQGEIDYLLVADVGDNLARHATCRIYFFPEPSLPRDDQQQQRCSTKYFDFRFEGGPRDCEAVAVDPLTHDIWLIEKCIRPRPDGKPPGVFCIPKSQQWLGVAKPSIATPPEARPQAELPIADQTPEILVANRVGDFPYTFVSGMDFSREGTRLIVRNYLNAFLFERSSEMSWCETLAQNRPHVIPLPLQRQGETIAFTDDATQAIVTSEFVRQPIWQIDLNEILRRQAPAEDR